MKNRFKNQKPLRNIAWAFYFFKLVRENFEKASTSILMIAFFLLYALSYIQIIELIIVVLEKTIKREFQMNIKEKLLNMVFGIISLLSMGVIFLTVLAGLAGLAFGFGKVDPAILQIVFWASVVVLASSFGILLKLNKGKIL